MAILAPNPRFIAPWVNGAPVAFGTLETYAATTTTPKVTYQDATGSTPNATTITLDANGVSTVNIFIQGAYKFVLKNVSGTPIYTVDNIIGYTQLDWTGLTATIAMLNATDTSCVLVDENYTSQLSDRGKTFLVNAAGGPVTYDLLSAPVATNGFQIYIKKVDNSVNEVIISAPDGETIDGEDQLILGTQWDTVKLISDGGSYYIIAQDVESTEVGFTTGDAKLTLKTTADATWVMANDGTIGDEGSGATTRANEDTQNLFNFIYATFTNDVCPIFDSSGALSTRTTAEADWTSLKAIRLTQVVGRALAIAGQPVLNLTFTADPSNDICIMSATRKLDFYLGTEVRFTTTGTLPAPLALNTSYFIIPVDLTTGQFKLATTNANAALNIPINITDAGLGIQTLRVQYLPFSNGVTTGEQFHAMSTDENGPHNHEYYRADAPLAQTGSDTLCYTNESIDLVSYDGSADGHNNMQLTAFMNAMVKL